MNKVIGIISMAWLCCLSVSGTDTRPWDYSPKSPEAAAYDRVSDLPVSEYTGGFAFSVPIYTLTCGDISLPISLDYQGSAVRVDQEASWVGLNWLLNAGGAITTRIPATGNDIGTGQFAKDWAQMEKLPMRTFPVGDISPNELLVKIDGFHPDWRGQYGANWFQQYANTDSLAIAGKDITYRLYHQILDAHAGATPTYHASFGGHSLTFAYDRLKGEFFITGRKQNFRIEGTIARPVIIDGKGVKYTFGVIEQASAEGSDVNYGKTLYDYTFYLSSIESPCGNRIDLIYSLGDIIKPLYTVDETYYGKSCPTETQSSGMTKLEQQKDSGWIVRKLSHFYTIKTARLTEIRSRNISIHFNASKETRKDVNGTAYKLDNIEIYRRLSSGDELLRRFRFSYSYLSESTSGGNVIADLFRDLGKTDVYDSWFGDGAFMSKRLCLDGIWEEDISNSSNKIGEYGFTYTGNLPSKASASVDYWGYYNAAENYNGLYHTTLPKGWDERTADNVSNFSVTLNRTSADRRPNERYTASGMLRTIKYPLGGTATIEYEPNTFSNLKYFDSETATTKNTFASRSIYWCSSERYAPSGKKENADTFDIRQGGCYQLSISLTKSGSKTTWRQLLPKVLCLYTLTKRNGQYVVSYCQVLPASARDTLSTSGSLTCTAKVKLAKGRYCLAIAGTVAVQDASDFYQADGKISYVETPYETRGAGVRVRSVVMADGNGQTIRSTYDYARTGGRTSGLLMSPAIFAREKMKIRQQAAGSGSMGNLHYYSVLPAKEVRYVVLSGSPLSPGLPLVGYGNVTVRKYDGEKLIEHRTRKYWNNRWCQTAFMDYAPRIEDPRNGLTLSDSTFTEDGELLRTIENSYSWKYTENRMLNASVENLYSGPAGLTEYGNVYAAALHGGCMNIMLYPSVQFSMVSSSETVREYYDGGVVTAYKNTAYNQTNGLDSLVASTAAADGEVLMTETFYPCDCSPSNENAASLAAQHINEIPLETVTSIKNKNGVSVTADRRYEYSQTGLLASVLEREMTSPLSRSGFAPAIQSNTPEAFKRNVSISYNAQGRPREVIENDRQTIYLWGYGNQFPTAVVKGTSFKNAAACLGGEKAVNALEEAEVPTLSEEPLFSKLSALSCTSTTAYAYDLHGGITKTISPYGMPTTYGYDVFGRLTASKDCQDATIRSYRYTAKSVAEEAALTADGSRRTTAVQYFDGLGRPALAAVNGLGGNGKYVYTAQQYRGMAQVGKQWLPAVGGQSVEHPDFKSISALSSATYGESGAFSQVEYDFLGRPAAVLGAGDAWHKAGKRATICYVTNKKESVRRYAAPCDGRNALVDEGFFEACQLRGERCTDEDGHTFVSYSDRLGRKVLERRGTDNDTYFVYNDFGQLRFVLSPQYQENNDAASYAYEYRYDSRGNVAWKRLPDCSPIRYWYDDGDRVVFMQDGVLRARGLYRFFLYDCLCRPVVQDVCTGADVNDKRFAKATFTDGQAGFMDTGYVLSHEPALKDAHIEKVCYYDDYAFLSLPAFKDNETLKEAAAPPTKADARTRLCGSLSVTSRGDSLLTVCYYDEKGRLTEERRVLPSGTLLVTQTAFSFTDKPVRMVQTILRNGQKHTAATGMTYNTFNDRLANVEIGIDEETPQQARSLTYNDLGQVGSTSLGKDAEQTSFAYNVRGWLTRLKGKTFEEQLAYTDAGCYNGDVGRQQWQTAKDSIQRSYSFSYDALDRLTQSEYSDNSMLADHAGRYDEQVTGCTQNGAITGLTRYGKTNDGYGLIDDLSYTLCGNQLERVEDKAATLRYAGAFDFSDNTITTGGAEYVYNENGAMTADANRGITLIEYDNAGHPVLIQFHDGSQTEYVYSIDGEKLRTIHRTAVPDIKVALGEKHHLTASETLAKDSTDYCGAFLLENGQLSQYLFDGGYYSYAAPADSAGAFHYCVTDHLGNVRVVLNASGDIEQTTHYYPFGAPIADLGYRAEEQKRKYNGKELDLTHGLNTYDYGARQYHAAAATWDRVDRFAENSFHISPYVFCINRPISLIDENGDSIRLISKGDDKLISQALLYYNRAMTNLGITVSINSEGILSMPRLSEEQEMSMSLDQKRVYMAMNTAINGNQVITLNLENQNDSYIFGNVSNSSVDMHDVEMAGDHVRGISSSSVLIHETYENYLHYAKGKSLLQTHESAIEIEQSLLQGETFTNTERNVIESGKYAWQHTFSDGGSMLLLSVNHNVFSLIFR